MRNHRPARKIAGFFLTVVTGVGLVAALAMPGSPMFSAKWLVPVLWLVPPWVVIVLARRLRPGLAAPALPEPPGSGRLLFLAGCMVLSLYSSAVSHRWFYFLDWVPPSGRPLSGMALFLLLVALFTPFLLSPGRRRPAAAVVLAVATLAFGFFSLWRRTGGAALYRDDHSSMMFRLAEISLTWPQLLNYIPQWNAGAVHYAGTASGLNGLGVIFWPLLRLMPVQEVYTPILGLAYIVIVPALAAVSVRLIGAGWAAAGIGAVLAAGVSRYFFLWMLHFGTVGACFASAFVLPVSAALFRVFWFDDRSWRLGAFLVASTWLLLAWPPAALMAAAVGTSVLFAANRWSRRKVGFVALCGAAALLAYLPQILLLTKDQGEFFSFLLSAKRDGGAPGAPAPPLVPTGLWREGWDQVVSVLHEFHPALVFFGIGGTLAMPVRSIRRWFLPPLLALAVLACWGAVLKPNLQLTRMAIPLAFLSVAPAALFLERLARTRRWWWASARALVPALLVLTAVNLGALYRGGGPAAYTVLGRETPDLVRLIEERALPGGRVLFAGKTEHAYSDHGHIALLPLLARREMLACDYYAFSPKIVEYNYPPKPFRESHEKLWKYMEAYDVGLVLTRLDNWKKFLRQDAARYEEFPGPRDITVFVPRRTPGRFLIGEGTVRATFNRLDVQLAGDAEEVVLKYAWAPGLAADGPVEIRPYEIEKGYELVAVRPRGAKSFTIRFLGRSEQDDQRP